MGSATIAVEPLGCKAKGVEGAGIEACERGGEGKDVVCTRSGRDSRDRVALNTSEDTIHTRAKTIILYQVEVIDPGRGQGHRVASLEVIVVDERLVFRVRLCEKEGKRQNK